MANKRMFSLDVIDTDKFWSCLHSRNAYISSWECGRMLWAEEARLLQQ